MYSWYPGTPMGAHVPVGSVVNRLDGSVVCDGACPHGHRISSEYECTSTNVSTRCASSRCLTLRFSGSLNAVGPT